MLELDELNHTVSQVKQLIVKGKKISKADRIQLKYPKIIQQMLKNIMQAKNQNPSPTKEEN